MKTMGAASCRTIRSPRFSSHDLPRHTGGVGLTETRIPVVGPFEAMEAALVTMHGP